jgi:hypothetical protein
MVLETVDLTRGAIEKRVLINLIINNRASGNAPLIAPIMAASSFQRLRQERAAS